MQVATLHGLGLAIVTSHSLAQVLELIARYCKVISSTMEMSLAHDKHGTTLAIGTLHGSEARHAARLAVLAFVLRQANSLSQHLVQPIAVHLRMSKLSDEVSTITSVAKSIRPEMRPTRFALPMLT